MIPNTARDSMRSGIVGTLANDGPKRVVTATLKYTFSSGDENYPTPSRLCSFASDGTVYPGNANSDPIAGLILGNERVPSDSGESWYQNGDAIELIQFGEIYVNIDNIEGTNANPSSAAAVGGKVYYLPASGKLVAASGTNSLGVELTGAVITAIDSGAKPTRLARIVLNGPQPA